MTGKIENGRLVFLLQNQQAIESPTRIEKRGVNTYKFFKRITKATGFAIDVKVNGQVHTVNKKSLAQYLVRISTDDQATSKKVNTIVLAAFEKVAQESKDSQTAKSEKRGFVLERYTGNTNKTKVNTENLSDQNKWEKQFAETQAPAPLFADAPAPRTETSSVDSGFVAPTLHEDLTLVINQVYNRDLTPGLLDLNKKSKELLLEQLQAQLKIKRTLDEFSSSDVQKSLKSEKAHYKSVEKDLGELTDDKIQYQLLLDEKGTVEYKMHQTQDAQREAENKLEVLTSTTGVRGAKNAASKKALKSKFKFVRETAEAFEQSKVTLQTEIKALQEKVNKCDGELQTIQSSSEALLKKYSSTQEHFVSEIQNHSKVKGEEFIESKRTLEIAEKAVQQEMANAIKGLKDCGIPLAASFVTKRGAELKGFNEVEKLFNYTLTLNQTYFACLKDLRSKDSITLGFSTNQLTAAITQGVNSLVAKGALVFSSKETNESQMIRAHEKLFVE